MGVVALKVAVLMGGPSGEHEVSLRSGRGVVEALTRRGWAVEPIAIPHTGPAEEAWALTRRALQGAVPDVVFIALHGPFGEDGTIQELCEDLRLPYTGSAVLTSRLGLDKVASKQRFEAAGLSVPRWQVVSRSTPSGRVEGLAYPLVVKPTGQGSSLGVSIVRRKEGLAAALEAAGRYGGRILVEEFVAGRELTVGVLGDEPLPIVEVRPRHPFFDYTAKYTAGLTEYLVPAPLAPDIAAVVQAAGLSAHRALGCRHLSRTDLILREEGVPVILEVNTIPGLTPTSLLPKAAACAHLSYDELCEQLVMMAVHGAPHVAAHR